MHKKGLYKPTLILMKITTEPSVILVQQLQQSVYKMRASESCEPYSPLKNH